MLTPNEPTHIESSPGKTPLQSSRGAAVSELNVLIAEDDPVTRLMLERTLARWGYSVRQTDNGEDALESILTREIDLVVTDWEMPGLSGAQLCRRVRAQTLGRYVYMLLLTSHSDRSRVVQGLEAGADDYLTKPFDPIELRARLAVGRRYVDLDRRWRGIRDQLRRANERLSEQAATDPLMGIGNRRAFERSLTRIHANAVRERSRYGVIMADIDHFKQYNDRFGHQAGDQVLRRVADLLSGAVRLGDEIFRYGGEEIVLIAPSCGDQEIAALAERLRRAVQEQSIEHPENPYGVVTVSFGCSSLSPTRSVRMQPREVLERADQALYKAKERGRNQVELS